jgi:quercetin dioxygenase-like cupin family protein
MTGIRNFAWELLGSLVSLTIVAGSVAHESVAAASPPNAQVQILACKDSPVFRTRPAEMGCAILARKVIQALPPAPIVWRLETFPTAAAARAAEGTTSVYVKAAGRSWLVTLGTEGQRTPGGKLVTEIGPVSIPRASKYEIVIGEAYSRPGASTKIHTHPGPEAWYLLTGAQCLEMPGGAFRADAGKTFVAPANTPMKLTVVGTSDRDSLFFEVGDSALPWSASANWLPNGQCKA